MCTFISVYKFSDIIACNFEVVAFGVLVNKNKQHIFIQLTSVLEYLNKYNLS